MPKTFTLAKAGVQLPPIEEEIKVTPMTRRPRTLLKRHLAALIRRRLGLPLALAGTIAAALIAWAADLIPAGWMLGAGGQACRVERVSDGDTLQLRCGVRPVKVRLYCIDAPEMGQRPWGERSRAHLESIATREVKLVKIDRDQYGRIVGEVYTVEARPRLLNLEQVKAGQAAVYDRYCDSPRYAQAEREAKLAKRGIWSRPGEQQTPWRYRQHER